MQRKLQACTVLFMVFTPRLDAFGPVELLQDHDPGQVVGEGHFAHGQLPVGLGLDRGVHAEGGPDQEAGGGFAGRMSG